MMYKRNVVAAIKVGGKVLREDGDEVVLPFGSEYSVLLKNLNAVRVMARVSIDGKVVTADKWLVIDPNASIELERFIRDGNMKSGNKLKFIERTKEIEQHRGIEVDDGLVRVEWKTEKIQPIITYTHCVYPYQPWVKYLVDSNGFYYNNNVTHSGAFLGGMQTNSSVPSGRVLRSRSGGISGQSRGGPISPQSMNYQSGAVDFAEAQAGITVPGSESSQAFHETGSFPVEPQSEVLVLHLKGCYGKGSTLADKPVTVETKVTCSSCGRKHKSTKRFCNGCGTALHLVG